jgi:tetratricopeptide (TPR) repeat protein
MSVWTVAGRILGATVVAAIVALQGCAMVRTGSFQLAQESYARGDYRDAIHKADQVLCYGRASVDERARAVFIKAQAYEQLSEVEQALALYAFVAKEYPRSPEAYQASMALARLAPARTTADETTF